MGEKYKLDILSFIQGNYLFCVITGIVSLYLKGFEVYPFGITIICLTSGIFFFLVFIAIARSSIISGLGATGAASKLSFIIPVVSSAFILNIEVQGLFWLLIPLSVLAILYISPKTDIQNKSKNLGLLFFIWLGSGLIDLYLGILGKELDKQGLGQDLSLILIFAGAGLASLVNSILIRSKNSQNLRSILWGIPLGLINYYSIYFVIAGLREGNPPNHLFYLIYNIAVVVLSFISGLILFKEDSNKKRYFGLILAVVTLAIASLIA